MLGGLIGAGFSVLQAQRAWKSGLQAFSAVSLAFLGYWLWMKHAAVLAGGMVAELTSGSTGASVAGMFLGWSLTFAMMRLPAATATVYSIFSCLFALFAVITAHANLATDDATSIFSGAVTLGGVAYVAFSGHVRRMTSQ